MEGMTEWFWCQEHQRAESADQACRAEVRLGPYPSREAAEHWQERVDQRNDAWEAEDRRWSGDDEAASVRDD